MVAAASTQLGGCGHSPAHLPNKSLALENSKRAKMTLPTEPLPAWVAANDLATSRNSDTSWPSFSLPWLRRSLASAAVAARVGPQAVGRLSGEAGPSGRR